MITFETRNVWTTAGFPWWKRWLLLAAFFVLMAVIFVGTFIVMIFFVAAAALSRLFPSSWRHVDREQPIPAPLEGASCPWCGVTIETEPVAAHSQRGVCSGCGRHMERRYLLTTMGNHWSPWQALIGSDTSERRLT